MIKINSLQNSLIKNLVSLQQKKNIVASELCFLESKKVVLQFLISKTGNIKQIFITDKNINSLKDYETEIKNQCIEVFLITQEIAKKISTTKTNAGFFATLKLPKQAVFNNNENFLVLDGVQDPTNVGAIARSALAFGFKQIFLINSAYPYTPKMIRTSMGYVFNINFFEVSYKELQNIINAHNLNLIGADMFGEDVLQFKPSKKPIGLVLGNEGSGVSENVRKLCSGFVKINTSDLVESLNVATSGAIIMHLLNSK